MPLECHRLPLFTETILPAARSTSWAVASGRATSEPTVSTMAKISYAVFAEAGTALTHAPLARWPGLFAVVPVAWFEAKGAESALPRIADLTRTSRDFSLVPTATDRAARGLVRLYSNCGSRELPPKIDAQCHACNRQYYFCRAFARMILRRSRLSAGQTASRSKNSGTALAPGESVTHGCLEDVKMWMS